MRIEKMRFKEAKVLLKEIIKRLKMNNSLLDEQDAVVEEIVSEKLQELKLCNKLKGVQSACADAISAGIDDAEYQLQPSVIYNQIKDKEIADLNDRIGRQKKTIRKLKAIAEDQAETISSMEVIHKVNRDTFEFLTHELEAANKVIADLTKRD